VTATVRSGTLAVALVALLISSSCGVDDPLVSPSVVGVRSGGCSLVDQVGTGVAIGDDLVATVAHTLAGANDVRIVFGGRDLAAVVVGFDPEHDVAILRVPQGGLPAAPLGFVVADEDGVLSTWNPRTGFHASTVRITRQIRVTIEDIYVHGQFERQAFEIAGKVAKGDSGAPVFNDKGEVVGVIYAALVENGDVGFAVDGSEIKSLLERTGDETVDNGHCK